MVGNVRQWCSDWHGAYNPNDTDNPKGAATGTARVLRGGAWDIGNTDYFRCAVRAMSEPAPAGGFHSFRVVFRASSQTTHSKEPPKPEVRGAVNPKDGAALASIPAGEFVMGEDDDAIRDYTLEGIHRNNPRHTVKLSGYYLYKNVVTVGQYEAYCKAEGKQMPSAPPFNAGWAKKSFPIVRVTWDEARAYAKWAGGDLPSEAQWERAARGTDGRKFPWGDTFDSGKLWCSKEKTGDAGGTAEVGRYGFSPSGCSDMAGNVWQWCLDWYDADYWKGRAVTGAADPVNLNFGLRKSRVLRGGSWYYFTDATFPCAGRMGYYPNNRSDDYGFRVALRALR
ncbi:hypothetical protein LBMAG21_09960 [Armatimonadota bacterium]|nr:hypothetical protein LBMAG21_09960 [Armatimonadota bacterium]